ncbi:MAG: aminotransferase class I/II-fold pyridoxal phosphate-dependent enzyme [Oligoflexia bacterium]|nr:aminotransferase class I/II-fold pyridoxal phosphate-dependent enzyme [Oligoflexia bacterium]
MLIPFEEEYKKKYYSLIDQIFDSNFWSDGKMLALFEEKFSEYANLNSVALSNGGTALLSIFHYLNVKNYEVIIPTNTFYATSVAAKMAGADIVYADCNRGDLCISLEDIKKKVNSNTKAVVVVHIGGHIAFEIEEIALFCRQNKIYLVEDCAHSHGATFLKKAAGHWGFAGAYSFYATKTLPLGEGGMVVTKDQDFVDWLKIYRNYGKKIVNGKVSYPMKDGFNYRMSEFTAALGVVQLERLPKILDWKRMLADKYDKIFSNRVHFPPGMESGFYKYIVFDYSLKHETGKVFSYSDFGHAIDGTDKQKSVSFPNSDWISEHHKCPPIYLGWEHAEKTTDELRYLLIGKQ